MRIASVYRRKRQFLIHASAETTAGVWMLWEPCLAIPEASDDEILGQALRSALEGSRSGVPHPKDWNAVVAPFLHLAGVKSWSALAKGATSANIREDEARVTLLPMRNLAAQGKGFEGDDTGKLVLEQPTPRELGAALRAVTAELA